MKYRELSGHGILVNTSFNVRGEPIVETPEDAINCFLGTNIDFLVLGNILVQKKDVPKRLISHDFKDQFSKD